MANTVTVSFAEKALPKGGILAITVFKSGALGPFGADLDKKTKGAVKAAIKAVTFKGGVGQIIQLLAPKGISAERLILVGAGDPKALDALSAQKAGAAVAHFLTAKTKAFGFCVDLPKSAKIDVADAAASVGLGVRLGTYRFDTYRTQVKDGAKPKIAKAMIHVDGAPAARKAYKALGPVADGVMMARDLVNEPPNILNPAEFASRIRGLSKLGLKVSVLNEKKMEELGMGSLLGVGQGSANQSKIAIMEWKGGKVGDAPIALVGKGLTFDSGGISLKPGGGMQDMKGDMGGAAAVTGAMMALAGRKAKANVVGIVGLVENMPDAAAQRPGDIVTSMSGQTIEIINTDAEGRLVLADVLYYTAKRFKPKYMVDLATLTGAILVALGDVHAGMFTNSDEIASGLSAAGEASGEKVWRLPLHDDYDKMINSEFADMKNAGVRNAGSITAAQFLQRFTNKVPWCHLDVAGTAMGTSKTPESPSWASGYGVRLLNRWVADNFE
jgi:leucyl aminopeptidase